MAQIKALKQQIDDLNSKRLEITADATAVQSQIAEVKKEISDLNGDIKLGVQDDDAQAKLADLKAELDSLNDRSLAIRVDKAQADADLAALKLELDRLTQEQKIKVDIDKGTLQASLDDAKSRMDDATQSMSNDWAGVAQAGQAASLRLASAIVLLLPALVPLTSAVLGLGGAMVSAFGGAAVAAGVFGASIKSQLTTASTYNSTMQSLNLTLTNAQERLAVTSKTSTSYASNLLAVQQAQAAVNAENAKVPAGTQMVASSLTQLKNAWTQFQSAAGKSEDPLIARTIGIMSKGLQELLPIIPAVTKALNPLVDAFDHFVNGHTDSSGSPLEKFVNWIVTNGVPNLQKLLIFLEDMAIAVGQIGSAFTKQGDGLTSWLDKIGTSLDKWGANGGFQRFAEYVQKMMPEVIRVLDSLRTAVGHIIQALNDFGSTSLTQLSIVANIISDLPVGVIEAMFLAFEGYKVINAGVAAFKAFSAVVNGLKAVYAAVDVAQTAFRIGLEGGTAAESDNIIVTAAMAAGRTAMATATFIGTLATEGWTAAMLGADGAMAPVIVTIGLIVVAVAALGFGVYELYSHWNTVWSGVKDVFDTAWSALKQGFDDVVNFLRGKWGEFVLAIPVIGWMIYVAANWKSIWGDMQQAFSDVINAIKAAWDTVSGALKSAWDDVWNAMKTAAFAVWNALQSAWDTTLNAVRSAWDTVSSALTQAWDTAWNALKSAGVAVWDALQSAWSMTLNALKSAWDTVSSALSGAWDNVWNALKSAAELVWNALSAAWTSVIDGIKSAWDTVSNTLSSAWSTFWDAIKSAAELVWTGITNAWNSVTTGITSALTTMKSTAAGIWNDIQGVFEAPINFIIGGWNDVAGVLGLPHITPIGAPAPAAAPSGAAAANHAGALGKADGGIMSGPGGPREDRIPAMLSNGEYVINAKSTSENLPVLDHINGGGTAVAHFADGGAAGGYATGRGGTIGGANVNNDPTGITAENVNAISLSSLKNIVATAAYDVAKPVFSAIESAVPDPVPGVPKPAGDVPHDAIKGLGDAILNKLKSAQSTAQQSAASVGGTIPTGEHLALIDQALQKAGVPNSQWAQWEAGLNTLITRESGWNPTAINLTDSNAAAGHPSQGLMQTIPSTFAAYSLGGSITDPLSNIVAGIRYIIATYGGIGNVQQANANLPPKGYDTGGALMPGLTLANNTTGTVEGVLNPTGLAGIGGLGVLSSLNSGSSSFRTAGGANGGVTNNGGSAVTINAPITINGADLSPQQIQEIIDEELGKLANMIESEVGTR